MLSNAVQYNLVNYLAQKHRNLCVVGDDDQSIYGWRGADIRNILDFEVDFEETNVIKLEQNYRSTKTIVEAAKQVVTNNEDRKEKSLWTESAEGELITVLEVDDEYKEAMAIVDTIKNHTKPYKEFAVLYRTNVQSRAIEEKMIQNSIPYRLLGGVRFYERKEIKDILAYLRVIANTKDEVALKRIINVPKRGIGQTTIDKITQYAGVNDMSFFESASIINEQQILPLATEMKILDFVNLIEGFRTIAAEGDLKTLIREIVENTFYKEYLEKNEPDDVEERMENIQELMSKARIYMKESDFPNLEGFLEEIALIADVDNYDQESDAVTLMTLHSSKGLEFPIVFIPGMEDGLFPSSRSYEKSILEEERRLAYVGITRAREKLYMLYTKKRMIYGETRENTISRFINEIDKNLVQFKSISSKRNDTTLVKKISNNSYNSTHSYKKSTDYQKTTLYTKKELNKITEEEEFFQGDIVKHKQFGQGMVLSVANKNGKIFVKVDFNGDTRELHAKIAKLQKL
ncbi:hypothetical protein AN640_08860 [Candidatus Epulonipiscium fishelsonii]|uniref:Uncharacterized protein n=1 Tax=Candidatus Epulonipiscium fishelsonii TaxID=77094 RepID=A0ACC8XCF6_9FIRM|nr:hypothetical protein AN640_08860 [Epulopiscium sp. SCG-D08WGA-EpuloA1]